MKKYAKEPAVLLNDMFFLGYGTWKFWPNYLFGSFCDFPLEIFLPASQIAATSEYQRDK